MWVKAHFFYCARRGVWYGGGTNQGGDGMADNLWVLFEATGQKFPVRYYNTSDRWTVELPAGQVYEGEHMSDLRRELKADFKKIRITSK
jgi:hypothetical protein